MARHQNNNSHNDFHNHTHTEHPNEQNDDPRLTTITSDDTTEADDACCELCGRQLPLTRHHLIPQSRHNKARTKRQFNKADMQGSIAMICRPCHSQVHKIFENHELADYYHTVERLKSHSDMNRFIQWIKKRPAGLKVRVR